MKLLLHLFVAQASLPAFAAAATSQLWGDDGELWDPTNGLLYDFTDAGYKLGDEPIPDWPVHFSVIDFGAVPNDDDVSDVEAFRRAIAACPPYHAILVPDGRYIIDEAIEITNNNIVIRGESRDGTILYMPKHMSDIDGTATATTPFITFRSGTNRGIESLSLVLRDEQKATGYFVDLTAEKQVAEHWFYSGENPIQFVGGEYNSWIRNVYIKNANHAIKVGGFSTKQISVIDIVIDQFIGRKSLADGSDGHFGIKVGDGADNCLVHNILFTGTWAHELAIMGTSNSVFSRIKGQNLEIDHHAMGNSFCLFTEVDTGVGGRGYGGTTNNIKETYWGIKGIREAEYLPTSSQATMVGINNSSTTSIGVDWHHETLDPEALVPANMYLAQMAKVSGKYAPTDVVLTLPPPASSDIYQLFAVADAMVDSGTQKQDTNYGFEKKITLKRNRREGFMKFDLSDTSLPTSVAYAKLRVYITGNNQASPFGFQVLDVNDDSWSESTLTWNNKPSAGSLIFSTYVNADGDEPAWIDVDLTSHVNTILAGDKIMSLKLQGDGDLHKKGSQINIRTKESGNAAHLVLYLDQSMIPAPSQPTSLVAVSARDTDVRLSWDENTESDFASYNVYRDDGAGGSYVVQAMGLTTTKYTDYVVATGIIYTYVVSAVDIAGSESILSSSATAMLTDVQLPTSEASGGRWRPSRGGNRFLRWQN